MGSLALDPNYWKKYGIANHLLDAVEKLAMQDDKIPGFISMKLDQDSPTQAKIVKNFMKSMAIDLQKTGSPPLKNGSPHQMEESTNY